MGKILKYCSSCEEGFAERFTFCPDCGGSLQAVEVNPIVPNVKEEVVAEPAAPAFISEQEPAVVTADPVNEPEPLVLEDFQANGHAVNGNGYETGPLDLPEAEEEMSPVEETFSSQEAEPVEEAPVAAQTPTPYYVTPEMHADEPRRAVATREDDGGYYVTVIQEKNVQQRNVLLMAATGLVLFVLASVVLIDLFTKDLNIDAVDDNPLFSAVLVDEIPIAVEEVDEPKKNDKEDGGGGGGGKNERNPASRGDLPDFAKNPSRPPEVNTPRMDNPSLPIPPPQLQANTPLRTPKEYGKWGLPNGVDGPPSNGPGSGGGVGDGRGTGAGSGSGGGAGPGSGGGAGGGNSGGFGPGDGSGGSAPPAIRAVTQNFRIISNPKAVYTDPARTNNVQGTVKLKVTLLASGQVGSITPVTRLPHGLTDQAIAAARQIRFEPKKVNGVPQSVIVTLDYSFRIY